jgi:hypothetical protein
MIAIDYSHKKLIQRPNTVNFVEVTFTERRLPLSRKNTCTSFYRAIDAAIEEEQGHRCSKSRKRKYI